MLLIAVVMTTATYRSVVNKQKSDWRKYSRAGETYDNHVNSFLILLVVLILILDINDIVKELLA